MRQYIKKLQSKNEQSRKKIFAGLMIFSMAFVTLVWMYSLGHRFNQGVKEQAREDIEPFRLFANSLSSTYNNISASVGKASISKNKKEKVAEEKQIDLILVEEVTETQ